MFEHAQMHYRQGAAHFHGGELPNVVQPGRDGERMRISSWDDVQISTCRRFS